MEQKKLSDQELKQKKFLLMLPIICIPFLTLMFWLMGGGKSEQALAKENGGLNINLPDAKSAGTEDLNKLDFYNQAMKDSLKLQELMKADPNYNGRRDSDMMALPEGYAFPHTGLNTSVYAGSNLNTNEAKIYGRLNQLQTELNRDYSTPSPTEYSEYSPRNNRSGGVSAPEVERLEKMMEMMEQNTPEEDPEMTQLSTMMDKILDIQHPDRVQDRLKKQSEENTGQVFSFNAGRKQTPVTVLDNRSVSYYTAESNADPGKPLNTFLGLSNETEQETVYNAIAAVVHETQTLVSGSTIKLRLTNEAFVNGTQIPKGSFIYGTVSLRGERLEIDIDGIQYNASLFPVKLSVFDLDGIAGIRIPGAITREVAKQNSDQAIQSMSLGTFDQSLGAQAATAGIELGKNLFSKKVKQIKVEIKAGYKVLLKDNKRKAQ